MVATLEAPREVAGIQSAWRRSVRVTVDIDKFDPGWDSLFYTGHEVMWLNLDVSCKGVFDLVVTNARELGENREASYRDICALAEQRGLHFCPFGLAFAFRKQYRNQPRQECIVVATPSITRHKKDPCLLGVSNGRRGLLVDVCPGFPTMLWEPDELFLFAVPVQ